ncbi:hypothetical protein LDENG_00142430 [Lucifuga dentata]|nr:hypothetical protein LDENG_00142430 [Lucifuga dentata]
MFSRRQLPLTCFRVIPTLQTKMSKSLKKIVEESRDKNLTEVEMCDRGINNMLDVPGLFTLSNITQLVLSHNKLTGKPLPPRALRSI